jgi:hypothetical protein
MPNLSGNIFIGIDMQGIRTREISQNFTVEVQLDKDQFNQPYLYDTIIRLSETDDNMVKEIARQVRMILDKYIDEQRWTVVRAALKEQDEEAISRIEPWDLQRCA